MEIKRFLKIFGAQMIIFQMVMWGLRFLDLPFPFSNDIDWPISLAWASMLILPLILTALHFKARWKALMALFLCGAWYAADFLLHFNITETGWQFVGYKIGVSAWTCLSLGICFVLLDQWKMAIIAAVMFLFGGSVAYWNGGIITTSDHYLWVLTGNILFFALTFPPLMTRMPDAPKPKEDQQYQEYRQAA